MAAVKSIELSLIDDSQHRIILERNDVGDDPICQLVSYGGVGEHVVRCDTGLAGID